MLPLCTVMVFLLGGCAGEEAPVPQEAPKGAGVGAAASPVNPELATAEKELASFRQKVEQYRKNGDTEKEIEALLELGSKQIDLGRADDALATYEKALSGSRVVGNRRQEGEALLNRGFLRLNEPEVARRDLEEALRLSSQVGDLPQQAYALHFTGNSYSNQGRYGEALSYYWRALKLAKTAGEKGLAADIWNAMGIVHGYRGEIEEAQRCYESSLKEHGERAATWTTIGWIHRRRGELDKARSDFLTALEIAGRSGDKEGEATVRNHLGGVHLDLGEPEDALREYEEALEIYRSRRVDDGIARAQFNIGQVYLAEGEPEKALDKFKEAKEPSRKADRPRTAAVVLHGIGSALLELGKPEEAIEVLEEALPFREKGDDRRGKAATLLELGRAYQAQGELDRAAFFMKDALNLAREAEASFVQASAFSALARLDRNRGELQDALKQIEQAIAILESIRSDLPGDRLKSSFFASKRSYYELYVDILVRLNRRYPGRGYTAKALQASEMARARSFLDLLAEGQQQVTRGINPSLRRQESEIAARLSQIQSELMEELAKEAPGEERVRGLRFRLLRAERERESLEHRIRKEHPRYAEVRYPSPLDLRKIQSHLNEDMALLEYSLSEEDGSYLFLVTHDSVEVHSLEDAGKIADQVWRFRQGVRSPGGLSFGRYLPAAHWLYTELVAPVRSKLNDKRLLLIAPDGPLHFLSFEALLTRKAEGRNPAFLPYLLRDFALGYIPSVSVLPLLAIPERGTANSERGGERKQFVAFADPDHGPGETVASLRPVRGAHGKHATTAGLRQLPRLEGSGLEVRRIADGYDPDEVTIYERGQANEQNVKGNPLVRTARRLHIAAHGVLNEERPALSGLRLTRTGEEDGLLQVYEIFNLDLKPDLVVLSACETALGKEVKGEGFVGLTRAFLYAGAPSVVVSLWRVDDESTPDLMVRFYKGLDRLQDKAQALREAKLEMIQQGGGHAQPYRWAPFILVGNPK